MASFGAGSICGGGGGFGDNPGVGGGQCKRESLQILDLQTLESLPKEWLINGASTVFQAVKLITWVLVDCIKVH